ncbi:MAG: radical SAM protein [Promethearchaeota archaeon]
MTRTRCSICKREAPIAEVLPVCVECLRAERPAAEELIHQAHQWRKKIKLPVFPPQNSTGVKCTVCANNCTIPEDEQGYCGLRSNNAGKLESEVSATQALMHYYLDPHVTNCCAAYFCPAGTGVGYPNSAYNAGPEYGYANLAVFFYGCGFSCLFCQNASHKQISRAKHITSNQFLSVIQDNPRISCVCYFGGSPEPQLPFTINVMERCNELFNERILRQCLEMNGNATPSLMRRAGLLAAESGGIIKFDLKAYSTSLNRALCGVSNEMTLKNFSMLAETLQFENRSHPPLMATTLLVPYYVDEFEVAQIAKFIKELNQPSIEYSLLIFHPQHLMRDLPVTPLAQAQRCYDAAKEHLDKVNIGNLGLLDGRLRL